MNRINLSVLIIVVILGSVLGSAALVEARSYDLTDLQIDATIDEDGLLHVVERRTVEFDGEYTGMFQWIDTAGGIKVRDVHLREQGQDYVRLEQDQPGPAGTFFVREESDSVYIDWSFQADDEVRTFILSYIVEDAVIAHNDVAELYYQFVGDQWSETHEHVRVEAHLPAGVAKEDIRAWGHGPLNGEVTIVSGQEITWEVNSLPDGTFLEGRVVFPLELVPGATRTSGREALDSILREEQEWADEANRRRQLSLFDKILGLLVVLTGIFVAVLSWLRYGKPYPPEFSDEYYTELPAQYRPAELAMLYRRGNITSADLTATLLDLARRGYLTIKELEGADEKTDGDIKFSALEWDVNHQQDLLSYEESLLTFMFVDVGNQEVLLTDIEEYAKKHRSDFYKFWSNWIEQVKEEAKVHHFFDEQAAKQSYWLFIPGLGGIILAIISFIQNMPVTGLALIAAGIILILTIAFSQRLTEQASTENAKWKAFRRYLLTFSSFDKATLPNLKDWERYLPYAVTLGAAREMTEQLEIVFPNFTQGDHVFGYGWYYYLYFGGHPRVYRTTEALDKGFNKSISTVTGGTSSGVGAGGGFSGGGGGGFGGGGGGAR